MGNLGRALAATAGSRRAASASWHCSTATRPSSASSVAGRAVRPMSDLGAVVRDKGLAIGVIATPADSAQEVCDRLVGAGVRSVLNFAPSVLAVPDGVDRPQGRPVDRAADPRLPRAAQGAVRPRRTVGAPMSLLVLGVSHHDASIPLLEAVALDSVGQTTLETRTCCSAEHVGEALVVATCNRVEVYAEALDLPRRPSPTSARPSRAATGLPRAELTDTSTCTTRTAPSRTLFTVACRPGLDGRRGGADPGPGPLGACARAQAAGTSGRRSAPVAAGPAGRQARARRDRHRRGQPLARRRRASHAAERARRRSSGCTVARRRRRLDERAGGHDPPAAVPPGSPSPTARRARRAAGRADRRAGPADRLTSVDGLGRADLVVSCTGAVGARHRALPTSRGGRGAAAGRPQVFVDLALPRDVEPAVAERHRVDLARARRARREPRRHRRRPSGRRPTRPRDRGGRRVPRSGARAETVAPTVVALRARAAEVVAAELARLEQRRPTSTDDRARRAASHRHTASSTSCCTRRPSGSRSSPARASAAATPRPCATCSTSTPHERRRVAWHRHPPRPTRRRGGAARRAAPRHPAQRAGHDPVQPGRRQACAAPRPEVELVAVHHHGRRPTQTPAERPSAAPGFSRPRCAARCSTARSTWPCTRSRTCRPRPTTAWWSPRCPLRADPRDALVARDGLTLGELPPGAVVGTGSPRRAAQLPPSTSG